MYPLSFKQWAQTAVAILSLIVAASASSALSQQLPNDRAAVSVYSSISSDLLDTFLDSEGIFNVKRQLKLRNLNLVGFDGKDGGVSIPPSSRTLIIPPISDDSLYQDVEDVNDLKAFVQLGGLIILHDSVHQPLAAEDLVAETLGYEGGWQHCDFVTSNTRQPTGSFSMSPYARDFLDIPWPSHLEDARETQVHSWCKHEDSFAVSYPLYTLGGDSMKVVAQAFSRVGTPGAVLWLGYSWQSGPQEGWGELLEQVITAFEKGAFHPPSDAALMKEYPLGLDAVAKFASILADDTHDIIRRFLLTSYSRSGYGYSGHGGYPPQYSVPSYPPTGYPSPVSPLPVLLPQQPSPQNLWPKHPSPQKSSPQNLSSQPTSPLPRPTPTRLPAKRFQWFRLMPAHGVQGVNRSVVWHNDADFNVQLNLHYNNSKLWLINRRNEQQCDIQAPCQMCNRAWHPYNGSNVPGFPRNTIVLYFREPVLLKRVVVLELAEPGVQEVFLLKWPAVPIPRLRLNTSLNYSDVRSSDVVTTALKRQRVGKCAWRLDAFVKPDYTGDVNSLLDSSFNQTHLPKFLNDRVVGGVGIKLRSAVGKLPYAQISDVRFIGRVLYPQNPSEYEPYSRPRKW